MTGLCKAQIITDLGLEPHDEGGYFRRTYTSSNTSSDSELAGSLQRPAMSSIYYLLTSDSPVGRLHRNRSDIMHYWHCGHPVNYWLLFEDGSLEQHTLGPDLAAGQRPQLLVRAGVWKATELMGGEFGLLSEAVCPGFEYADRELATSNYVKQSWSQLWPGLQRFCE